MHSERIQFGAFVLDVDRYELTREGRPVRMERIPMDLLILLVREKGRLVSREEIIERLWGKNLFFDSDNSINTAVRKIRNSLGDEAGNPQYVETVLGKGYRFKGNAVIASKVETTRFEAERSRVMLAVLPFENLSGDPGQDYFSDGLSEETIMRLGQMSPRQLGVIARTSSMAYKQTDKSVAQIGRELGVDYVLEGSVRRDGARVRITAQLIRVQDQTHLWAENYDRQLPGMLDIHGEIGAAIADQVKLELMSEERRQLVRNAPRNPEAHDLYLRGRYHYAKFNLFDAQKAVAYFQQATEHDPSFGLAHSGLIDALMVFVLSGDVESNEVSSKAKSAIAQAVRLDPESAELFPCSRPSGSRVLEYRTIRRSPVDHSTGDGARSALSICWRHAWPIPLPCRARLRVGRAIQRNLGDGVAILDRADLCGEGLPKARHAFRSPRGVQPSVAILRRQLGSTLAGGLCTCSGRGEGESGRVHSSNAGAEERAVRPAV